MRRGDVDRLGVWCPIDGIDPVVEGRNQALALAVGAVENPQLKEVGLVACPRLRPPGNPAAIRRVFRRSVRSGAGGNAFRLGDALSPDAYGKEVGVRRDLRMRSCIPGEDQLLAIGRDVVLIAATDGEGRSIELAGCEIASIAGERHIEDVAPRRPLPRLPVAIQQAGDDPRFRRLARLGRALVLDAPGIDAAVRIDVAHDDEAAAVRQPPEAGGAA